MHSKGPISEIFRASKRGLNTSSMLLIVLFMNVFIMIVIHHYFSSVYQSKQENKTSFFLEKVKHPSDWQRNFHEMVQVPSYVHFSSYRIKPNFFISLGLTPLLQHDVKRVQNCKWNSQNGKVLFGKINIKYPGESHARYFESIKISCEFVGKEMENVNGNSSKSMGGYLSMKIDGQDVKVYAESAGHVSRYLSDDYLYSITFCSSPLHDDIDVDAIIQWMHYHHSIHSFDHFHLYDAGAINDEILSSLSPYIENNIIDITNARNHYLYDSWSSAQVLFTNDCGLRAISTSKWIITMDIDEYLIVSEPPYTLPPFLEGMESFPFVTFGSMAFSSQMCTLEMENERDYWFVERLIFREPRAHCLNTTRYTSREMCMKWDGHRKFLARPNLVELFQIHRIIHPFYGGFHASTDFIRIHHFRGLGVKDRPLCCRTIDSSMAPPKGYVRDVTVANLARLVRSKATT